MTMAHYDLVFQGQIVDGTSLDEVKSNVARLFKADTAKIAALFSGKPIVIKKNLDTESAKKYLAVLKKAGAVIKAVKVEEAETAEESNSNHINSGHLNAGLSSLVNYNAHASTQAPQTESEPAAEVSTGGLQLAPVNSGTLTQEKPVEAIEIPDISHLDMSDAQTGSLEEFAAKTEPVELPNIENLTMSDADSGCMEEFTPYVEPAKIPDTSALNIAEQDDTPLSDASSKPDAVEIPDISGLSMSEAQEGSLEGIEKKPEAVKIPDISHLDVE